MCAGGDAHKGVELRSNLILTLKKCPFCQRLQRSKNISYLYCRHGKKYILCTALYNLYYKREYIIILKNVSLLVRYVLIT